MDDKAKKVTQEIMELLLQNNLSLSEAHTIIGQLYNDLPDYAVLTSSRQES